MVPIFQILCNFTHKQTATSITDLKSLSQSLFLYKSVPKVPESFHLLPLPLYCDFHISGFICFTDHTFLWLSMLYCVCAFPVSLEIHLTKLAMTADRATVWWWCLFDEWEVHHSIKPSCSSHYKWSIDRCKSEVAFHASSIP